MDAFVIMKVTRKDLPEPKPECRKVARKLTRTLERGSGGYQYANKKSDPMVRRRIWRHQKQRQRKKVIGKGVTSVAPPEQQQEPETLPNPEAPVVLPPLDEATVDRIVKDVQENSQSGSGVKVNVNSETTANEKLEVLEPTVLKHP